MRYEKPEILSVDDARKTIQQMGKDQPVMDNENGTEAPPGYLADE